MSQVSRLRDELRVKFGTKVDLSSIDPADGHGWKKGAAVSETEKQLDRLSDL